MSPFFTKSIAESAIFFVSTYHWSVRKGSKISSGRSPKGREVSYSSIPAIKSSDSKFARIFFLASNLFNSWKFFGAHPHILACLSKTEIGSKEDSSP